MSSIQVVKTKASLVKVVTAASATLAIATTKTLQLNLGKVAAGTLVVQTVKGPTGTHTLSSAKVKVAGSVLSPVLKFTTPGTYVSTITIGKIKRIVTIKVTK